MRNIPALDGYRGVAILLVMLYHGGVFGQGWAGVQLFFVLSSFLVTTILRSQRNVPDYYVGFLRRRARRLFPLYYLYLALAVPLLIHSLSPAVIAGLATFTFNFTQIFVPLTGTYALGHLWSLSIEVQFYLVWPMFVRWLDDRALRSLALAMVLLAPAVRFGGDLVLARVAPPLDPSISATFLIPFSHFDAFGWGALLAVPRMRDPRAWVIGACAAAVSLGCAPFAGRKIWTFAVVALIGAAMLRAALSPLFARFFSPVWLQFTGRISYGLYVWHHVLTGWILAACRLQRFRRPAWRGSEPSSPRAIWWRPRVSTCGRSDSSGAATDQRDLSATGEKSPSDEPRATPADPSSA